MTQVDEIQIAASRLLNTMLGGVHGEMVSSRAYRLSKSSATWAGIRILIDTMFFWQPNHCEASHNWENQ